MKKNSANQVLLAITIAVIFLTGGGKGLFAQTQCWNLFPVAGNTGVFTQTPQTALQIHGDTCLDLTLRLSYLLTSSAPIYQGNLTLLTPTTLNTYTLSPSRDTGDIVLQSERDRQGGNIIIVTRDTSKKIILTTTNGTPPVEYERVKVFPEGKTEFNTGLTSYGLPKITLDADGNSPCIKFYNPLANGAEYRTAYPWRIQTTGYSDAQDYGSMHFKWGLYSLIGNESVTTKVIYKVENSIGDVKLGINTGTNPLAMLHGTRGSVLFDGNYGAIPTTGAGTRFMWIPVLKALRAGEVTGTQWDNGNIGEYSVAFGLNNLASGQGSSAFGSGNIASGIGSLVIGTGNQSSGNGSIAIGNACISSNSNTVAFGWASNATGQYSISMGKESIASGERSIAIGIDNCISTGSNSIAIGNQNESMGNFSKSFGFKVIAGGDYSSALGNHVKVMEIDKGSFMIGDYNMDPINEDQKLHSNSINQITLRFEGDPIPQSELKPCYRFFTKVGKATSIGVHMVRTGNGWLSMSDSNMKRDVLNVNIDSILNKICNVPISTWRWKQDSVLVDSVMVYDSLSYQWIGPMAQDFYREFPIGVPDSTLLSESVMRGVTMAAVQALKRKSDSITAKFDYVWHKSGDSINNNSFIGSLNNQPLIFKTNSTEKLKITDNQVVFTVFGDPYDSVEANAAVKIYSDSNCYTSTFIAGNETGWRSICDRNKKENFESVDLNNIIESFKKTDITFWNYKKTSKDKKYIGPTAQDFYNSFKLGGKDSTSINGLIYDGVNFAGIKALIAIADNIKDSLKNSLSKTEFNSFKDSITCLADACKRIGELEKKLDELNSRLNSLIRNGGIADKGGKAPHILSIDYSNNDIILEQNNPNPFSEETKINYYLPSKYEGKAKLIISDEKGTAILQSHEICRAKPCQITISARDLSTGVYFYAITLDNQIIKSKKMMIIK